MLSGSHAANQRPAVIKTREILRGGPALFGFFFVYIPNPLVPLFAGVYLIVSIVIHGGSSRTACVWKCPICGPTSCFTHQRL